MSTEREAAIQKIKKLLRLSKSNNEHESAAAMRQANALMRKHGLDKDDVDDESSRARWKTTYGGIRNMHPTLAAIVQSVHRAFNTRDVLHEYVRGVGTKQPRVCVEVEFFGVGATAKLAAYAAQYMYAMLTRDRANHLRGMKKQQLKFDKDRGGFVYVYTDISRKEHLKLSVSYDAHWIGAAWRQLQEIAPDHEASEKARQRVQEAYPGAGVAALRKLDQLHDRSVVDAARSAGGAFRIHVPVEGGAGATPLGIGHEG